MKRSIIVVAFSLLVALSVLAQPRPKFVVQPDVGSLYAYDDNGRLVGAFSPVPLQNNSIGGIIRMELEGEGMIFLHVARREDGLRWAGAGPGFLTTDCTGPAYQWGPYPDSVGDRVAIIGLGGTLYVLDATANRSKGVIRSRVILGEFDRQCIEDGGSEGTLELREIAKLDDEFKPPFVLEAALRHRAMGVGR